MLDVILISSTFSLSSVIGMSFLFGTLSGFTSAFAAGVTFTTLTGMGLATGITLTAVGCSTDRSTMCNAGLITGAASAVGLYLSIDLLRRALPRVHIGQVQGSPYAANNTVGLVGRF